MAQTNAQRYRAKAVYGKQIKRGDAGEQRAMKILRKEGYKVSLSSTHPRGKADITATKGKTIRNIQVKTITSRNLATKEAARKRIAGKPFGLRRIKKDCELWVFDKSNRLYRFDK